MDRRGGARALDDHPLFAAEAWRQRRVYARHADVVRLAPGSVLAREGHEPTQVTFIRSGRAQVTQFGAPLAEVGPGRLVGADALARLEVSDVTVTALTPLDAVVLHRRAFRGAWRALPGVRARVGARHTVRV
jgi:CRP-like cAMP-binding protein